jgi:hypothetical protein
MNRRNFLYGAGAALLSRSVHAQADRPPNFIVISADGLGYGDLARIGITYLLTNDSTTVLRSGFGVSYVEAGQGGGQLYKNLPSFYSQVIATDQNGHPVRRLTRDPRLRWHRILTISALFPEATRNA